MGYPKKIASAHPFAGNCSRRVGAKCLLGPRGNDSGKFTECLSTLSVCRYEKELGFCPSFFPFPKSTRRDQGRVEEEEEADLGKGRRGKQNVSKKRSKKVAPGEREEEGEEEAGALFEETFPSPRY